MHTQQYEAVLKSNSMKLFFEHQKKSLVFLISVGQPYHEGSQLSATINLFENILYQYVCLDRALGKAKNYASSNNFSTEKLKSQLDIFVIIADTLQAYNDESYSEHTEELQAVWRDRGKKWWGEVQECFSRLIIAGKPIVKVNIYPIHWDALKKEATNTANNFHYNEYYDQLVLLYKNNNSTFSRAVNYKGNSFLARRNGKLQNLSNRGLSEKDYTSELDKLKEEWKETRLKDNNLTYIFEEFAVFECCLRDGLLDKFVDNDSRFEVADFRKLFSEVSALIWAYPGIKEEAFTEYRSCLNIVYKEQSRISRYYMHWLHIAIARDVPDKHFKCIDRIRQKGNRLVGYSDKKKASDPHYAANQLWLVKSLVYNLTCLHYPPEFTRELIETGHPLTFGLSEIKEKYHVKRKEEDLLKKLPNRKQIVVYGKGGSGKTHMARSYCNYSKFKYSLIIWYSYCNIAHEMYEQFLELNRALGFISDKEYEEVRKNPPKKKALYGACIKQFKARFAELGNISCLIVFDDAENQYSFQEFIPEHAHVIFTSHISSYKHTESSNDNQILLDKMSPAEALELLENISHIKNADFERIIIQLDYNPLYIVVAGAYFKQHENEIRNYLCDLGAERTIEVSVNKSIAAIDQKLKVAKLRPIAKEFLSMCVYLSSYNIPLALLEIWFHATYPKEDPICVVKCRELLADYALICWNTTISAFSFYHKILHDCLKSTISYKYIYEDYLLQIAGVLVVAAYPCDKEKNKDINDQKKHTMNKTDDYEVKKALQPHLASVLDYLGNYQYGLYERKTSKDEKDKSTCDLFNKVRDEYILKIILLLAECYELLGDLGNELIALKRAYYIQESCAARGEILEAKILEKIGVAYTKLVNPVKAIYYLERSLIIYESHTIVDFGNSTRVLRHLGEAVAIKNINLGKKLVKEAYLKQEIYCVDEKELAKTMLSLGIIYSKQARRKLEKSKDLIMRALRIQIQYYNEHHPVIAETTMHLGIINLYLKHSEEAEKNLAIAQYISNNGYGKDKLAVEYLVTFASAQSALKEISLPDEFLETINVCTGVAQVRSEYKNAKSSFNIFRRFALSPAKFDAVEGFSLSLLLNDRDEVAKSLNIVRKNYQENHITHININVYSCILNLTFKKTIFSSMDKNLQWFLIGGPDVNSTKVSLLRSLKAQLIHYNYEGIKVTDTLLNLAKACIFAEDYSDAIKYLMNALKKLEIECCKYVTTLQKAEVRKAIDQSTEFINQKMLTPIGLASLRNILQCLYNIASLEMLLKLKNRQSMSSTESEYNNQRFFKYTQEYKLRKAAANNRSDKLRAIFQRASDYNIDINAKGLSNQTALELAKKNGHQECVSLLLDSKAGRKALPMK